VKSIVAVTGVLVLFANPVLAGLSSVDPMIANGEVAGAVNLNGIYFTPALLR
jgi:hypothetical protein